MAWDAARALAGFEGGLLIGLAGTIMLLALGRIAGASGLTARALDLSPDGAPWPIAVAFVLGLPLGAALLSGLNGAGPVHMPPSPALLIAAGLMVGFGSRLGSGCTSGHGVCGLSRLSPRSMLATATFMTAAIATVALMRAIG
jgi:uncharacterized membrane protein YedE/YeeE